MKRIVVALLAVLSFSFPTSGDCSTVVSSSQSWEEREYAKRQPISHKWISSLEEINKKSHCSDARDIVDALRWDSAIVAPQDNKGEIDTVSLDNYPRSIEIVSLLPEDRKLNSKWEELEKDLQGSLLIYVPELKPLIIIKDTPMNDLWRGINFLHEGIALAEASERTIMADPGKNYDAWLHEWSKIEDSAWGTIAKIVNSLGGKEYRALVNSEKERLGKGRSLLPEEAKRKNTLLNLIFGNPLSPFEEDLRNTTVWVSAVIQLIDERNPDPLKAQEERFEFFYEALKNNRL